MSQFLYLIASVFVPIQKDSSGAEELKQFCSAALVQVDEQLSKCTYVSILVSGSGGVLVAGVWAVSHVVHAGGWNKSIQFYDVIRGRCLRLLRWCSEAVTWWQWSWYCPHLTTKKNEKLSCTVAWDCSHCWHTLLWSDKVFGQFRYEKNIN